jgi:hypothetical protein
LNNRPVTITHFEVSHGDLISFKENDTRNRNEEIRRFFYIQLSTYWLEKSTTNSYQSKSGEEQE